MVQNGKQDNIYNYIFEALCFQLFNEYTFLKQSIEIFLQKFIKKEIKNVAQIFSIIKSFLWKNKEIQLFTQMTKKYLEEQFIETP